MADLKETKQAQNAFNTLCGMLDDHGWKYHRDDEKLCIECGANGEDLPIDIRINVDADKQLVTLLSQLPFKVPEDDRVLGAVAISAANYNMVDGNFDYNLASGSIIFRLTTSFRESLVSKDVFEYMLFVSCATIDNYNDKFLMLIKKAMSLEDFIKFTKE
jgi:hypothetical protein